MKTVALALTMFITFTLGVVTGAALTKPAPAVARIYPPSPMCKPAMVIPVDFDMVIVQSGDGRAPVTRFYTLPANRGQRQ